MWKLKITNNFMVIKYAAENWVDNKVSPKAFQCAVINGLHVALPT